MKEALISTIEPVQTGYRVAQVEPQGQTFPVAPALFWTPCADDVVADQWYYDTSNQQILAIPTPPPPPGTPRNRQERRPVPGPAGNAK